MKVKQSNMPDKDTLKDEISINSDEDVIFARQRARIHAQKIGLGLLDLTRLVTAVSELGRNIVIHANGGKVTISQINEGGRTGIKIVFDDKGPGISDINKALDEGFSTVGSMGIGLNGAKKLVDEFDIESRVGEGTRVAIVKWK